MVHRFAVPVALALALVPLAWASTAPAPVVAVIDTGILPTHPEFRAGQVVAWKDFVDARPDPYDDHGHGTGVASRVAGATTGAWAGADLAVAKVVDANGTLASLRVLEAAILWAVDEAGADVVTVSIGNSGFPFPFASSYVNEAVTHARASGVLVTWSAGNWGARVLAGGDVVGVDNPVTVLQSFGSGSRHALVVGASTEDGRWPSYSRAAPDVVAWGHKVPVATLDGATAPASGTSFAAPFVAGVAARLLAEDPSLAPDALEDLILATAHDRPRYPYALEGHGLVDATSLDLALAVLRGDADAPARPVADAERAAVDAARTAYGEHPFTLAGEA